MNKTNVLRLWRVEWVHSNGYQAPYNYVEAKTKTEAIKLQRESKFSRLKDFPESWSWHLLRTNLIWSERKKTWIKEDSLF